MGRDEMAADLLGIGVPVCLLVATLARTETVGAPAIAEFCYGAAAVCSLGAILFNWRHRNRDRHNRDRGE